MKLKKGILACSGILLAVIIFLYLNFANETGAYKQYDGTADAIVVLTGGRGRLDNGLNLFNNGNANYLIIAGAAKDASLESIFSKKGIGLDAGRIVLEKKSTSTYENALEIKKIIEAMNIKSIILLTSYYHMKRASYTFNRIMPKGIAIYLYPVSTHNFDEKSWWKGEGPVLLAGEFLKLYWYRLWL